MIILNENLRTHKGNIHFIYIFVQIKRKTKDMKLKNHIMIVRTWSHWNLLFFKMLSQKSRKNWSQQSFWSQSYAFFQLLIRYAQEIVFPALVSYLQLHPSLLVTFATDFSCLGPYGVKLCVFAFVHSYVHN